MHGRAFEQGVLRLTLLFRARETAVGEPVRPRLFRQTDAAAVLSTTIKT
jgi:hypothetical protein